MDGRNGDHLPTSARQLDRLVSTGTLTQKCGPSGWTVYAVRRMRDGSLDHATEHLGFEHGNPPDLENAEFRHDLLVRNFLAPEWRAGCANTGAALAAVGYADQPPAQNTREAAAIQESLWQTPHPRETTAAAARAPICP